MPNPRAVEKRSEKSVWPGQGSPPVWPFAPVRGDCLNIWFDQCNLPGEIYRKPLVFDGGIGKNLWLPATFHKGDGCFLDNHQKLSCIESVTANCIDLSGGTSCGSAEHVKELGWRSYDHVAHVAVGVSVRAQWKADCCQKAAGPWDL